MRRRFVLASRGLGLAATILAFWIYSQADIQPYALVVTITGIVALVAPDVLDRLPWGPNLPK